MQRGTKRAEARGFSHWGAKSVGADVLAWLLFWTALVGALSCRPLLRPGPSKTVATSDAQRARAVAIIVRCADDGRFYSGSGVIIGARHVLTAKHVVDCDSPSVAAFDSEGVVHRMKVDVLTKDRDSARLATEDLFHAPAVVFGSPQIAGEICAFKFNPKIVSECGLVLAIREGRIAASLPAIKGNSGGGVYDSQNRLIGIVTHYTTCGDEVCGSIVDSKISHLKEGI